MVKSAKAHKKNIHKESTDMIPTEWPGGFDLYQYSKRTVYYNWQTILIIYLLLLVLGGLSAPLHVTGDILTFLVSAIGSVALIIAVFGSFKGKKIEIADAISASWPYVLNMLILQVLVELTIVASIVALIVPFFFIAPRFVIANYYIVDKKMGALEAYKASWNDTKGHVGKVYGIAGVGILMALPCVTIIGIPIALYLLFFYSASFQILYKYILANK